MLHRTINFIILCNNNDNNNNTSDGWHMLVVGGVLDWTVLSSHMLIHARKTSGPNVDFSLINPPHEEDFPFKWWGLLIKSLHYITYFPFSTTQTEQEK